jgi:glycosyltransferase involved in cell wall biosynthesis
MVSRRDMDAARAMVPGARLRYVPNAVDVAAICPLNGSGPARTRVLMVADFDYEPNRDAREWLVGDILPLIWRSDPQTRLLLVGRDCTGWSSPDSRIEVAGFVNDLTAAYAQAACVVVPLRKGGGTPLKFIEALAYRAPVIATGFAARGLEVTAGEHYLRADDPRSFAQAVLQARGDQAAGVAAAGRTLAETEYSVQALAQHIAA